MILQCMARRWAEPRLQHSRRDAQHMGLIQSGQQSFRNSCVIAHQPDAVKPVFFFAHDFPQLALEIQILLTTVVTRARRHRDQQPLAFQAGQGHRFAFQVLRLCLR